MYKAEYIPERQLYRVYEENDYQTTIAYEDNLEEAIKRWVEEE